jgi:D-apionate oxidoisomerase
MSIPTTSTPAHVVVLGAGGKMGYRVSANLRGSPYRVSHVEVSEAGRARLLELGLAARPAEAVLPEADLVILAIPDNAIGRVTHQLVDLFKPGAILVALDAAAPFAGELPARADLSVFVAHPCHPPIFNDETELEAKRDYFGGLKAKQAIVCAMMRGDEAQLRAGRGRVQAHVRARHARASRDGGPDGDPGAGAVRDRVRHLPDRDSRSHRRSRASRRAKEAAARDFILGHLNVELAILFDQLPGVRMSDAANKAVERAKTQLFTPDWKKPCSSATRSPRSINAITRA